MHVSTHNLLRLGVAAVVLCAPQLAAAAPRRLISRDSITALSQSQIDAVTPYAYLASAGYCEPSATLAWDCGTNCDAISGFETVASGGDGDSVQYWYVGFDPSLDSVVVSIQGTDPSEIEPLLTDGDIIMTTLSDSDLFPGLDSSIEAHKGFVDAHAKSATDILAAVQQAMSTYDTSSVTLTGHSLGAAISLLHTVYLPLHISVQITYVGFGLPRVGNQSFANYVDAHDSIASVTHVNNKEDPIPILPGMFLGYHHPSGEVHIMDSGVWVSCPGQDNESDECIVGDVPNIFDGDESDHDGPYNGVEMGC